MCGAIPPRGYGGMLPPGNSEVGLVASGALKDYIKK